MTAPAAAPPAAEHGATLARGAFFNTLAFLASNLRGIFTLLVARLLGSAALGEFGLAWAATDLVSKIGTVGFDTTAISFAAQSDAAEGRRLMRSMLAIALVVSAGVALAGFVLLSWPGAAAAIRPELAGAVRVMLLALPGIALYRVSNAFSRGRGVMHHDIYSRGFTESFATAAALLVALGVGARRFAPEIAAIAGTGASGLVAYALARRLFRPSGERLLLPPAHAREVHAVRQVLSHSIPVALYSLVNIGIMQIDVVMLGLFVGRAPGVSIETLGIYAAAVAVAGGLRKVNQAFTPIFTPVVARQMSRAGVREAEATYAYLARWMLTILLPAVAALAIAGDAIMAIYGRGFRAGGQWVAIIGAACALNAFVGLGELILMVKRPGLNLVNSSVAITAAIALNLVLIPALGPLGAAIGMLVPYALQGVLRGVEITYLFGWRWPWRALAKPWIAAAIPLAPALILRAASPALPVHVAAGIVYLVGYFGAWQFIGMDAQDRAVWNHLRGRVESGADVART